MMASIHTDEFERAISISPLEPGVFKASLSSEWAIGDAPHGGYLAAIFHRVATTHVATTHTRGEEQTTTPISLQLAFVRRSSIGPARFDVKDVKLGARTSVIQITMSQHSRSLVKIIGTVTMSSFKYERGLSAMTSFAKNRWPGNIPRTTLTGANWTPIQIPFPNFRKATTHVAVQRPTGASSPAKQPGVIHQRASLEWREPQRTVAGRWTIEAATFLLDIFPDALQMIEQQMNINRAVASPVWFPTLTLNIDFRKALPTGGAQWLFSRVNIRNLRNGRMNIDVVLTDESGDIVAIATHMALAITAQHQQGSKL